MERPDLKGDASAIASHVPRRHIGYDSKPTGRLGGMRARRLAALFTGLVVVGLTLIGAATGLPIVVALPLAGAAVLANGLLATLEDDLPGGFNNPDGATTPRYARVLGSVGRWAFTLLIGALSGGLLLFGLSLDRWVPRLAGVALAAAAALAGVAIRTKRRWALWCSVALLAAALLLPALVRQFG
jgi:hypothetical protein